MSDSALERLYPSMSPAARDAGSRTLLSADSPGGDPDQDVAHRLFPSHTSGQELRDVDPDAGPEERLYGRTPIQVAHADALRVIEQKAKVDHLMLPDEARSVAEEWGGLLANLGIDGATSHELAQLAMGALRHQPSQAMRSDWASMAREALLSDFGVDGAGQALADAQALIAREPALRSLLDATGTGNHPTVVRRIAARARALRAQGRL